MYMKSACLGAALFAAAVCAPAEARRDLGPGLEGVGLATHRHLLEAKVVSSFKQNLRNGGSKFQVAKEISREVEEGGEDAVVGDAKEAAAAVSKPVPAASLGDAMKGELPPGSVTTLVEGGAAAEHQSLKNQLRQGMGKFKISKEVSREVQEGGAEAVLGDARALEKDIEKRGTSVGAAVALPAAEKAPEGSLGFVLAGAGGAGEAEEAGEAGGAEKKKGSKKKKDKKEKKEGAKEGEVKMHSWVATRDKKGKPLTVVKSEVHPDSMQARERGKALYQQAVQDHLRGAAAGGEGKKKKKHGR